MQLARHLFRVHRVLTVSAATATVFSSAALATTAPGLRVLVCGQRRRVAGQVWLGRDLFRLWRMLALATAFATFAASTTFTAAAARL